MQKGIDYIGVCVAFYCHDGEGNYLFHKRSENCRDEHHCWDCGGGGLKFNETISDGVIREVEEEYGVTPLAIEELGYGDVMRKMDGKQTHWIAFRFKVLIDRKMVINNEPEKHSELGWFKLDELPQPLHSQIPAELVRFKDKL
jgi:ADP-ribose pyrophosphatase YjhB (NUDIX family)